MGNSCKGGEEENMKQIQDTVNKVWDFLDGKKTLFGGIILFGVYVARGVQQFFGVVVLDEATLANIETFGVALAGTGLIFKGIKRI